MKVSIITSLFIVIMSTTTVAQAGGQCVILIDGKEVPILSDLNTAKKTLHVSRDIEFSDPLILLYWYDAKIIDKEKFIITPQILFFVDSATKKTVKQEFRYEMECKAKDANISKGDLVWVLRFIQQTSLNFFKLPSDIEFGVDEKLQSECCNYTLQISKIKHDNTFSNGQFLEISVAIK